MPAVHTALDGWTPAAVPALWAPAQCAGGGTPPPTGGNGGGGSCNASTWSAGTACHVGDVVEYPASGNYYECSHDNPSYDPTISILGGSFGETIRTINGGLERNGANYGEMQDRVQHCPRFCQLLGVDPGSALPC